MSSSKKKIRVLVIEDSAFNRRTLVQMLESATDVTVVGTASDGEDGLRQAISLRPDVITVDLEMPRIDGFTFLRLLMAKCATPVIVVSSYARKADVFKALELGAFDFVAKPSREAMEALAPIREELLAKIRTVRMLRRDPRSEDGMTPVPTSPLRLVAIGASTGGPPALQRVFSALPAELNTCVLVAQHMPEKFTTAFAERLDKHSNLTIAEARGGERLGAGKAFIAPGGKNLAVVKGASGPQLEVRERTPSDKYLPCIDVLFSSLVEIDPRGTLAVLLTGMGSDGRDGMVALRKAGARTVAESEESAVIFGMPKEAIASGAVEKILSLEEIIPELVRFSRALK